MRRLFAILFVVSSVAACNDGPAYAPKSGDIVFHTSRSSQSQAIQLATHSRYSHMGVVYVDDGKALVYEAVQPVKLTPLAEWVKRGESGHFVAKRLRNADTLLTPKNLKRLKAEGRRFQGKSYDLYFEWSDDRIYCSELVWKMYHGALGIEVGRTQRLEEFDLSNAAVQAKIRERWKGSPPKDEVVISPAAMFDSELLITVHEQ
ncbi:MAG: YiiX family permuted papain-like enzyme [Thermoanaerobaculia bacterium]